MKTVYALSASSLLFVLGCSSSLHVGSQWEYTGGPIAQNISTVLIDEKLPGNIYVGLSNGEVFHSTDDGITWTRISTIWKDKMIYRLLQDPENWEKLYACTEAGAFVSSNKGKIWSGLRIGPDSPTPIGSRVLAVDPWKPKVVYAGLRGKGLYKSSDGCISWRPINEGVDSSIALGDVYDIKIDLSKPDNVYAAVSGVGVIKSTNGGSSWAKLTDEFAYTGSTTTHVLVNRSSNEKIVYATNSGNIFKSTNGGQSWSPSRYGLESDRILTVVAHPTNPDILFAGSETGILVSNDFGTTWTGVLGDLPRIATSVVVSTSSTNLALYAFGGGIGLQISADAGLTWHHADAKLGGATVSIITTDKSGEKLFAAVGNTVLSYNEQSGSWVPASTGLSGGEITSLTFDTESSSIMYATTPAGAFRSTNEGDSWQPAARTLRMIPVFLDFHPFIRTRMFASGEQGLFISTDKGNSWIQSKPLGSKYHVRSMTYTPTNAGIIHGATRSSAVISTANGGFTWESTRYGITNGDIVAVTLDDKDPQVYYAWTAAGEGFRSTNRGIEWNRYAPPWKPTDKARFAFDRYQPSRIIALVNRREVYYSPSGGGTWFPMLEMDLHTEAVSLCWNVVTSRLCVGTKDKGVYRLSLRQALQQKFGE